MQNLNSSTQPLPGSFNTGEEGNILIIDGDSIPWMIGWHHREHTEVEIGLQALDSWMREFLTLTGAKSYLGVIAPVTNECFRKEVYKMKPYKGNRSSKDAEGMEWIHFWEPEMWAHLLSQWGFQTAPRELETDDVVAGVAYQMLYNKGITPIVCSPDKDLRQIPGANLNYKPPKKKDDVIDTQFTFEVKKISATEARWNWCMQMLCGDTADNIAGIPGIGEKKAEALLKEVDEPMWKTAVKRAYEKHFGPYYGEIIYAETAKTVTLMTPEHPLWEKYERSISSYHKAFQNCNLCTMSL